MMPNTEQLIGHTVYGRKAALHVHLDRTSRDRPTLAIDAAWILPSREGYDWGNKLYLQLTVHELPKVTCTFLGMSQGCVFDQRGSSGKGFEVKVQDQGLFFRVWQGPGPQYMVKAASSDAFHLAAIGLRACRGLYGLDDTGTLAALRACARLDGTAGG